MSNIQLLRSFDWDTSSEAELAGFTSAGWYFWDEHQAFCYGPYNTSQEAREACDQYVKYMRNG